MNISNNFAKQYTQNMTQIVLGVDIDDVINNSVTNKYPELIKIFCKEKGLHFNEKPKQFRIEDRFSLNKQHTEEFIKKYIEVADFTAEIRRSCVNALLSLKQHPLLDTKIVMITARSSSYYDNVHPRTEKYLKDAGVPFNSLIVDAKDKGQICKELGINFFIDDNIYNCQKVLEKSASTVTFIRNHEYNEDYNHPELIRVNNLTEYRDKILQIALG